MLLSKCIENIDVKQIQGHLETEISHVAFDSRKIKPGGLFVAISGFSTDGHLFIKQAIEQGASAIVVEKDVEVPESVTLIKVDNGRLALAHISANFYGHPTEKLNMVGITGTNGKTSISYFIKALLEQMHYKTGVIGTMGTLIDNQKIDTPNTTPESLTLQGICADMASASVDYCIMEVSSHALDLNRVAGCRFKSGIYTNLTPDHLELHHDMASYFAAKAKLFKMTDRANIINMDDPYGKKLKEMHLSSADSTVAFIGYSLYESSEVMAKDIEYAADHSIYTAVTPKGNIQIRVNIPGEIYIYNSLAVVAWAYSEGFELQDIAEGISALKGVKGRFETVYDAHQRKVVIDFAHTEDGLEKALSTLRPFVKNRLLLVFGVYAAPGHLGLDKRLAMGKVAAEKADYSFVTSDNPKEQDPLAIIADVVSAMAHRQGCFTTEVDRKKAIEMALESMEEGDILLISGKGHETAQVIGKVEVPFNETEIVKQKMTELFGV